MNKQVAPQIIMAGVNDPCRRIIAKWRRHLLPWEQEVVDQHNEAYRRESTSAS